MLVYHNHKSQKNLTLLPLFRILLPTEMTIKSYANLIPSLIFSCLCTYIFSSLATDTISATQTLSGDQTIVSSGGNFELGFFTLGKSSRYYIGIRYKKVSEQTVIWVANRETPIFDTRAAQLKILEGNLVMLNESQVKIWSTDLNSTRSHGSAVFAVLQDNGNLVLQEKLMSKSNSSSSRTIWESFNHPGNTWMPGAKVAYDKRTHQKQALTSWKNLDDPTPGLFSNEPTVNDTQYVLKWNKSEIYWRTVPWNGRTFTLLPEMHLTYVYNFTFVDNENESYFTYSLYNSSIVSRMVLDVSGQIKQFMWVGNTWILFWTMPRQQCEVYAYCGAFGTCNQNSMLPCSCLQGFKPKSDEDWNLRDYSGGCVRETILECQNNGSVSEGRRDKFLKHSNVVFPSYIQSVASGSQAECESACLSNCSCSAYAYDENGCSVWNGELLNLQQLEQGDGSGKTIHIRYSASSSIFHSHKGVRVVPISIPTILIVLAVLCVAIWNYLRRKTRISKGVEGSLVAFSYKDLQIATKGFSIKLGSGGFGSVFKGTLLNSRVVAVKKLESINQGEKQFRTEVSTIGSIQHMNLVKLLGFCPKRNKKLLVYDYMENGSLDSHLFNAKESSALDWKIRYQIALGIARGLAYLHEKCRECIIHCDVKPENILLDANHCPKVGDFGLAKIMGHDFSRVLTTMRGTRGYLAPEWLSGVPITTKIDVYSYGMILFELVSGKRNSEYIEDGTGKYFPCLVASAIVRDGDILGLLDPILDGDADVEEVSKICKVACWSIQDDENLRPSMGQVVQILEGVMDVSLPPIPRSLQLMLAADKERIMYFSNSPSTASSPATNTTSSACQTPSP